MAQFLKRQVDLRVFFRHLMMELHRAGVKGVPQDAHGDLAPEAPLSQLGRVHPGAAGFQDPGALLGEGPSRRGEGHIAGASVKELEPQLLLQGGGHAAQGGLGDEQIFCGLGKAQPLGQHQKAL